MLRFRSFLFSSYSRFIRLIAYGPWGPIHSISIFIFRILYKIPKTRQKFRSLGEFFLRSTEINTNSAPLICPTECRVIEGPSLFKNESVTVKGLRYAWACMPELADFKFESAYFWNFYLAPHNYHWVHAPAAGKNARAYWHRGLKWPVNDWGRRKSAAVYAENERLTFQYETEEFGKVWVICVGALGVSSFRSSFHPHQPAEWTKASFTFSKGQQLLGFEMGSSVLLVVEKNLTADPFRKLPDVLNVGDGLQ